MKDDFGPENVPKMAPTFRLQWEDAQQSYVILYPEGMVKLNPAAGEILSRCDGQSTVAAIIESLERKFPDADGLSADVLTFLKTAYEQQWIQHGAA
ncbi:MAG: pyrroloquinoline quinone biosynthesis peptide chaperone PqqD [Thiohalocapsa sp.]